ncbi:MAG TPA: protein kinase [Pyrinomonadaceae bacterium]|nr:protein kinase [Pyrinomonadaceae bacterium]
MDQSRDKRIMDLVRECAELDADARGTFLDAECNGDGDLRSDVEALLAEDGDATGAYLGPQHLKKALPDHYHLIDMIGSGGMAEVFLAEDTRLKRKVAIKFLNDAFRRDPERMLRFNQEARSASALNHPNIITIHDIGEQDGIQYIVSEFVDGETLATRMTRGRLSVSEAVDVAIKVVSALDVSHKAGIIHRDLKPENIMLRHDGGLKVVDFGLAKGSSIFGHNGETLEVITTSPGMILGTPRYMSPEQTRGLPLDGRSDIFSLGIILFEMVTGRTPFPGKTTADTLAAILGKEPRPIAEFIKDPPRKLVSIIDRTLKKDIEDRYRSMAAVLADLEDLRIDLTIPTRRFTEQSEVERARPWALIAAATLVAILIVAGGLWYFAGRGRGAVPTAGALRNVPIASWASVSAEGASTASFSPDARMVAFGSTKSGASEIWSKPVSGGDPIQVTKNGFYNQYPVWSPDGQELVFFSSRGENRGLWKVSFTGGQESQLLGGVSPLARPLRWARTGGIYFQDGEDISVVDPASGIRKKLTDLAGASLRARSFAVSPDGTAFAISVKEADTWKLKFKRFDDASFVDLFSSKEPIDTIAFHPNGTSIFYADAIDGTQQIFETTTEGAAPVQVSSGATDLALHDISPDGNKILYGSINETSDLWLLNVAEKSSLVVANDVSEEYWADFSPDGRSIAYESAPQADRPFHGAILVKQVTAAASPIVVSQDGFSPVWSNDGQWIAYFRRTDKGISIWKVRPSGADSLQIADGAITTPGYLSTPYLKTGINHISWSPDGLAIAYSARTGTASDIWSAAADGSGSRAMLSNSDARQSYCCVTWKADGSLIAFTVEAAAGNGQPRSSQLLIARPDGSDAKPVFRSKDQFRFLGFNAKEGDPVIAQKGDPGDLSATPAVIRVYVVSLKSGEAKEVTSLNNAYFHNIHLSHDGRTIAFVTRASGATELWTVPVAGGTPKRAFAEDDPKVLISSLVWSPDGRSIIFGKQTRTNLLSMLTN